MKKTILTLNILLFALSLGLTVYYDAEGGLMLKGITASTFVALGLVNLIYAWLSKVKDLYPVWIAVGLATCMAGDIVLNIDFIPGVILFALGHVVYCVAFSFLEKPRVVDLIPIAIVFAISMYILNLPFVDFGHGLLSQVAVVYALVISCMVGKTIANFARHPSRVHLLLLIGSLMFYFSDLMLVIRYFGGGPRIADTLCVYTYFPGQCLLAHSVYHLVGKKTESK